MTQATGHGPLRIPPPVPVVAAAALICLEALGVVILAAVILVSGLGNSASAGQLVAQAAYYVVLAAAMVLCGLALFQGRRWGRTPTIVVQIILLAVAYWMAVPSGRPGWGIALAVLGLVTGGLLITRPANEWISRFPSPFGPEPDR